MTIGRHRSIRLLPIVAALIGLYTGMGRLYGQEAKILATTGLSTFTFPVQANLELACPSGQSPLSPNGTTYDTSTNKYRQWLCFDSLGNITIQGATVPSGPLSNPITFPVPTSRLTSPGSVSAIGIDQSVNAPNGVPAIWATNPNSAGTQWFPIPYIVVNGLTPANLSAQNFVSTTTPPTNGINVQWARTGATGSNSSQQQISAAIVGDGNGAHNLTGFGTFAQTNLSSNGVTCSSASGTTCTTTVNGSPSPYSSTPLCVVTPASAGITSFFLSSQTISSVTITYAPSGAAIFNVSCVGVGQP